MSNIFSLKHNWKDIFIKDFDKYTKCINVPRKITLNEKTTKK